VWQGKLDFPHTPFPKKLLLAFLGYFIKTAYRNFYKIRARKINFSYSITLAITK